MSDTSMDKNLTLYIQENQASFYRVAYSYVKDTDTAFDIIQEAIIKALKNRKTLKNGEYLKTWFYRILINECLMYIRKNKKIIFLDNIEDYMPVCDDNNYIDKFDDMQVLYSAIEKLEPNLKTIIILRFFEDMKLEEIAKVTNTKLSTVKSRLYKALDILRIDINDLQ